MTARNLRPMGVGEILDTSFRLYRDKFITFLAIALVVYLPYSILIAGLESWAGDMQSASPTLPDGVMVISGMAGAFLFTCFVFPLCTAAMTQTISAVYLGEEVNAISGYRLALPRLFPLLLANFLSTLIVFVGYLLCIVPGVIFTFWFWLVPAIVVLEKGGPIASMKRSRALMSGNVNKGFFLGLAIGILVLLLTFGIAFLMQLIPWSNSFFPAFFNSVSQAFLLPLSTAAIVLLYYDLRIRKEAFDLEQLASEFGQSGTV